MMEIRANRIATDEQTHSDLTIVLGSSSKSPGIEDVVLVQLCSVWLYSSRIFPSPVSILHEV
jgi:hypothetical protein